MIDSDDYILFIMLAAKEEYIWKPGTDINLFRHFCKQEVNWDILISDFDHVCGANIFGLDEATEILECSLYEKYTRPLLTKYYKQELE